MTALLFFKKIKYCQFADALSVPGVELGGAVSARRETGEVPPSRQGIPFLIQKLPREEMRLLLRSPPPQLSLLSRLCFATAFPSAFPSLCRAGFCRALLFCPSLGIFHPAGSLGASLRAGPVARTCSGWLAASGRWRHLAQPLRFGSVGGTRQMLLAAGVILEPAQKSLPVLS